MTATKMNRRAFLKGVGLAAAGAALASCAPKATPQPEPEPAGDAQAQPAEREPVTLTTNTQYWDANAWPLSAGAYRDLLNESGFEWLSIEYEQTDATTLETRMAAGDAPDIVFVYPELAIPWAARKQLLALTPGIDADPEWKADVDACIPAMNEGYVYKGDLYGLTIAAEAECVSYNPKQFEKMGIPTPQEIGKDAWTLEKFAETFQAVADAEDEADPLGEVPMKGWDNDWGYNSGLGDIAYAFGGKYFSDDGLQVAINSPEFVAAVEFCAQARWDGWAINGIELSKQGEWLCLAFANQRAASVIAGDWCWGWAHKTQLERDEFAPEMFYIPSGSAGRHPLAHSAGESIYTRTKNKDAALEYIKFGFTKEYQETTAKFYEEAPRYPARHDAAGPIIEKELLPEFFAELFDDSWPSPATPAVNFMGIIGYWNDTFSAMLEKTDTRSVQEIMDELAERTQKDMDAASAGLDL